MNNSKHTNSDEAFETLRKKQEVIFQQSDNERIESSVHNLICRVLNVESQICELKRLEFVSLVNKLEETISDVQNLKSQMKILISDLEYRKKISEDLK